MKLLVRSALGVSARLQLQQQTRALSGFREQAVRAVTSKLRSDLESNPNLWLSASAVVRDAADPHPRALLFLFFQE